MGFIDNSDWVRSSLATQLANLQNQMMPSGQAWQQYLNFTNPLMSNIGQQQDPLTAMFMGQLPAYIDATRNSAGNIQDLYKSAMGNYGEIGQGITNTQLNNANSIGSMIPGLMGLGNPTDIGTYLSNELSGFGGNYANNQMGAQGNQILANGGATPYTQNIQDIASYYMKQGGHTNEMAGPMAAMNGMLQSGGMTPGLNKMSGFGEGLLSNGGMNPTLNMGSQAIGNILSQGGKTQELNGINQNLMGELSSGGYGKLGPGFDKAYELMNGGGLSEFYKPGGNIAMQYAMGGGPSFTQGLGMSMPTLNLPSGGGGVSAGGVSRGAVDSGYTGSINDILAQAKEILSQNPLIPMNEAITMARDQAATATVQGMEAAQSRALARGNGAASGVSSGLQNQGMMDYANEGAQNEAAAMRQMALNQQGLQLQKYGIGADLTKAMEQVAASRNASSSQLAGQEMSANASLQAAAMSANAQLQQAQMQAALSGYNAQANLFGQLAQLKAQQQMGGLEALLGFSNQGNQQILGGMAGLTNLQNSANDRYGKTIDGLLGSAQLQNNREANALNLIPGISNAANANMNTGAGLMSGANELASKNFLGSLSAAPAFQGEATKLLNTMGNLSLGAGQLNNETLKVGQGLSNDYINNNLKALTMLQNLDTSNQQNKLTAGKLGIDAFNSQTNATDSAAKNNLGLGQLALSGVNGLTNAQNEANKNWLSGLGMQQNQINTNNNALYQLAALQMGLMQNAQTGYAGIGMSAGGGSPFSTISTGIKNLSDAAANFAPKG